jgi:flagellar biosynthesis/type III secretory pathway protein FliH
VLGDAEVHEVQPSGEAPRAAPNGRQLIYAGVGVLLAAVAVGLGAYFIGKSTGADLDSAKAAGEAAGRVKGAEIGARRGYALGFKAGRKRGYEKTFAPAYRRAYRKAYVDSGLAAPNPSEIDLPQ